MIFSRTPPSRRRFPERGLRLLCAVLVTLGALGAPPLPAASAAAGTVPVCGSSTVTVSRLSSPVLYTDLGVGINSAYEEFKLTNNTGAPIPDVWATAGGFSGPDIGLAAQESGTTHLGPLAAGASVDAYFYLTASANVTPDPTETHTISVYSGRPNVTPAPLCASPVSLTSSSDITASANTVSGVGSTPKPNGALGGVVTITVTGKTGTIGAAGDFATTPASYGNWPANSFQLTGSSISFLGGGTYNNVLFLTGLPSASTTYTATFDFIAIGSTTGSTTVSPISHISSGTQIKHTTINTSYTSLAPIPQVANYTTLSYSETPTPLPSTGGTTTDTVTLSNSSGTAGTASSPTALNDIDPTLPSGQTYVAGSAKFNGTPIADPSMVNGQPVFIGTFPVPAGGTSALTFRTQLVGVPGTYTTNVVGHVGTTQIDSTLSTTDNAPASATVTVDSPPVATSMAASASPSSVAYGSAATLSVSGLPTTATGIVTFANSTTTLCTATLPATNCSYSATLAPGTYPVTASYSGDPGHLPTSASTSLQIVQATPSITSSVTPSPAPYGTPVTLAVHGLSTAAAGTVEFKDAAGAVLCSVSLPGTTTCATSASLAPGSYAVTAHYSGSTDYTSAVAPVQSLTIQPGVFTMSASASVDPVVTHSTTTLTAGGIPGTATGTVTFSDPAGTVLCSTTLPTTGCSYAVGLAPGQYSITARYSGSGLYAPETASTVLSVTSLSTPSPTATTMTIAPALSQAPYQSGTTFTATGLPSTATGTLTFTDSAGTVLCSTSVPTVSCGGGSALPPGSYTVTGTYSGNATYAGTTATTSFTVVRAATSLGASATPSVTVYGVPTVLTGSGLPSSATGTITFTDATGAVLCTTTLATASCSSPIGLTPGSYAVTATYSGDSNFAGSTATTGFTVNRAASPLSLVVSPSVATYGEPLTLTVGGLASTATGVMIVTDQAGTQLCSITLPDTACSLPSGLPAGRYTMTLSYPGNADYLPSTATATETIAKVSPAMTAAALPSDGVYGASDVALSWSGLPTTATGTVTFTSGSATLCATTLPASTCTTSATLNAATYPVTATYSGDANFNGAVAFTSFNQTQMPTTMAAALTPSTVTYGQAATVTISGLPSSAAGTVRVTDNAGTLVCTIDLPATSCSTGTLQAGSYTFTAAYSGAGNLSGSSAGTGTLTVARATVPVSLVSIPPAPTESGTSGALTLVGVGLPNGATGTLTFQSQGVVLCTATLPSLSCVTRALTATGPHAVQVLYSGDANFAPTTSALTVTVAAPSGAGLSSNSNGPTQAYAPTPARSPFLLTAPPTMAVGGGSALLPGSALLDTGAPFPVTVPAAKTGEPWAGWLWWVLVSAVGGLGGALIVRSARSRVPAESGH